MSSKICLNMFGGNLSSDNRLNHRHHFIYLLRLFRFDGSGKFSWKNIDSNFTSHASTHFL